MIRTICIPILATAIAGTSACRAADDSDDFEESGASAGEASTGPATASCVDDCREYYDCRYSLCLLQGGSTCSSQRIDGLQTCDLLTESDCTSSLLSTYGSCDAGGGHESTSDASGGESTSSGWAESSGDSGWSDCTSTCDGCCTQLGTCLAGTTAANCGSYGESCESCSDAEICDEGLCAEPSCAPPNGFCDFDFECCSGVCDDDFGFCH